MSTSSIRIDGIAELNSLFVSLAHISDDLSEVFDQASIVLHNRIRARFLNTESPDGGIWPVSQAAVKRASPEGQTVNGHNYKDGKTLFMSGALFHSIQPVKISPLKRAIRSDMSYASYHNEGIGQVQRTFLGWNQEDADILMDLVRQRINQVT
jgi:phage gpG-like protein